MSQTVTEQISAGDWNATPPAVQQRLLALEREVNVVREQLQRLEHAREAQGEYHRQRLQRYHTLVEQQFLSGLTPEDQQEIEQLGREIDAVNATSYPSLDVLAENIAGSANTTRITVEPCHVMAASLRNSTEQ